MNSVSIFQPSTPDLGFALPFSPLTACDDTANRGFSWTGQELACNTDFPGSITSQLATVDVIAGRTVIFADPFAGIQELFLIGAPQNTPISSIYSITMVVNVRNFVPLTPSPGRSCPFVQYKSGIEIVFVEGFEPLVIAFSDILFSDSSNTLRVVSNPPSTLFSFGPDYVEMSLSDSRAESTTQSDVTFDVSATIRLSGICQCLCRQLIKKCVTITPLATQPGSVGNLSFTGCPPPPQLPPPLKQGPNTTASGTSISSSVGGCAGCGGSDPIQRQGATI